MTTAEHQQLRAQVEAAAQSIPMLDLSFRSMFGGIMIYASNRPFASLAEDGLAIKLNATDRQTLLLEAGAKPLQHDGEQPSLQYVVVPPQIIADPAQLSAWLARSATFVASLPAPKKKASKQRPTTPGNA